MEEKAKSLIGTVRMQLAIKTLERRASEIEGVPTFRGIPATAFDKEHLVMMCIVFANEWHKAQQQYFAVLKGYDPTYKARAEAIVKKAKILSDIINKKSKPSLWRKIWNKIRGSA